MTVTIRRAGLADLEGLRPLFSAYRVFYRQESDPAAEEHYLNARMSREDAVVFVAEDERGCARGFTLLYPTFDSVQMGSVWVLHDLYVDKPFRRKGMARKLMLEAQHFCRGTGALRVDLATAVTNTVAQPLYESLGYRRDTDFYVYSLSLEEEK